SHAPRLEESRRRHYCGCDDCRRRQKNACCARAGRRAHRGETFPPGPAEKTWCPTVRDRTDATNSFASASQTDAAAIFPQSCPPECWADECETLSRCW